MVCITNITKIIEDANMKYFLWENLYVYKKIRSPRQRAAFLRQPAGILSFEQRQYLLPYMCVIPVEPFQFLVAQQGYLHQFGLDRSQGERFKSPGSGRSRSRKPRAPVTQFSIRMPKPPVL